MIGLIRLQEQNGAQVVDARELHSYLESETRFNDWVNRRIREYQLTEGVDYTFYSNLSKTQRVGGRPSKEYALTLSCAKELAMVEGNAKGKAARLYFIECERRLKEQALLPRVVLLETEVADLKQEVASLKAAMNKPLRLRPAYAHKALPASRFELGPVVSTYFGPPAHDQDTRFMSIHEVMAYLRQRDGLPNVGYKTVAQAIAQLIGTGSISLYLPEIKHSKRGYWLQLLKQQVS